LHWYALVCTGMHWSALVFTVFSQSMFQMSDRTAL
jgi:hypothetical protein